MAIATFEIHGMNCQGCANSIEHRLKATVGVSDVSVDFQANSATVNYDDTVTNPNALEKVIESLGFDVLYGMGRGPRSE